MKIRIKLFDIYILLITICKAWGATAESKVYLLAFLLGCAAIGFKIIQERFTVREAVAMVSIVLIGVISYLFEQETTILFTAVALCGLKGVEPERVIKLSFWTMLTVFAVKILAVSTGMIENEMIRFWRNDGFISRYKLGYYHPNTPQVIFAIIALQSLYLYGHRMNLLHYGIIIAINQMLYQYTMARTGMLIVYFALILFILIRFTKIRNVLMRLCRHIHILMLIATIAAGLLYSRLGILQALNGLLTGRIEYMHKVLTEFIPPLFGRLEYEKNKLDNGYLSLLYHGGMLAFCWMFYFILRSTAKLYREKRYRDFFLVVCFAVFSLAESFLSSISLNISLIFIGEVLFERRDTDAEANHLYPNLQSGG